MTCLFKIKNVLQYTFYQNVYKKKSINLSGFLKVFWITIFFYKITLKNWNTFHSEWFAINNIFFFSYPIFFRILQITFSKLYRKKTSQAFDEVCRSGISFELDNFFIHHIFFFFFLIKSFLYGRCFSEIIWSFFFHSRNYKQSSLRKPSII